MKITDLLNEDGRIVKGVNTTVDVGPNEIKTQAAKFGNTVDKDGRPPTLSTKVKGKSTNVLFNLGLAESVTLQFQRGDDFDTLHIKPKGKNRVELRGKPGYERGNYDAQDKLHQVLDNLGKAANFAELMNGEVVTINPKHPDGERANKTAQDILSTERKFTPMELACMEGGHDIRDLQQKEPGDLFKMLDEKWSKKYKRSINCNNPKGFSQKAHCAGRNKNESIEESLDRIATESLVEALGQIDPSTEIYVDMDGVLADFFGEWAKAMGKDNFRDIEDPANAIKKIKTVEDFWLNLPMLPQAKELLLLIKKVKGKYKICTSPLADDPRSEPHKRQWVKDHLDFFPPEEVLVTHNKPQFATQEDGTPNILIDDYGVNINAWEKAGGIGFKYKDHKFERTAKAIRQHVQQEDAPPGREKQVKKLKKKFDDPGAPYAIAWAQHNKHGRPKK